jgi:TRAP-type C4-dicarboxylate transport system substrate-binding protein
LGGGRRFRRLRDTTLPQISLVLRRATPPVARFTSESPIKDIFTALRHGDVDGLENPYSTIWDYKYYEHQKYLSDSAHVLDLIAVVVNRKAFMSLQPREQNAIREAGAIACAQQWKMAAA